MDGDAAAMAPSGLARTRVRVFLAGAVQGVFLRSSIRSRARVLRVTGWIRNLPDGRVEAVFEGDRDDVDELVAFCRAGPGGSRIDACSAADEAYTGEFDRFEIRSELFPDE